MPVQGVLQLLEMATGALAQHPYLKQMCHIILC